MQSEWIQETTAQDEASPRCSRATRPPVHHGDLEEGRPHKIISNRQREASRFTEIQIWGDSEAEESSDPAEPRVWRSRSISISRQQEPGNGRWSQGACGPSEGSLKEREEEAKEEEEREEEEEAIESVTQLAACGNRKQKQRLEKYWSE